MNTEDTVASGLTIKFQNYGTLRIHGLDDPNTIAFIIEQPYNRNFNFDSFNRAIKEEFGGDSVYTRPIAKEGRLCEVTFTMVCMGHEIRDPRGLLTAVRRRLMTVIALIEKRQQQQSKELSEMLSKVDMTEQKIKPVS